MSPSSRRGRPASEASAVPPRLGLSVGDWIILLACRLGVWAGLRVARRSQRCLLGRAFTGKPVREGPRVYEPDNIQNDFYMDGSQNDDLERVLEKLLQKAFARERQFLGDRGRAL